MVLFYAKNSLRTTVSKSSKTLGKILVPYMEAQCTYDNFKKTLQGRVVANCSHWAIPVTYLDFQTTATYQRLSGTLNRPAFDGTYNDHVCSWVITAPVGNVVQIQVLNGFMGRTDNTLEIRYQDANCALTAFGYT